MDQNTPHPTPGDDRAGVNRELSALSKALTRMMGAHPNSANESPESSRDEGSEDLDGHKKDSPEEKGGGKSLDPSRKQKRRT